MVGGLVALVVVLGAIAAWCVVVIVKPYVGWWVAAGWRFRGAEPSGLALGVARAGAGIGLVLVVVGGIVIVLTMAGNQRHADARATCKTAIAAMERAAQWSDGQLLDEQAVRQAAEKYGFDVEIMDDPQIITLRDEDGNDVGGFAPGNEMTYCN